MEGELRESWDDLPIQVCSAAVTPDMKHLVTVGMAYIPAPNSVALSRDHVPVSSPPPPPPPPPPPLFVSNGDGSATALHSPKNRMIVYDFKTRQVELYGHACLFPSIFTHRSLRTGLST